MVIFKDSIFIAQFGYNDRHIPKKASFRWDPEAKRWWTDNADNAAKLFKYLSDEAKEEITRIQVERQRNLMMSTAQDADIDIPAPEGLSYFPYQRAGIAFGYRRQNVLIADEMGLGKTIQAIGIVNMLQSVERVLIVCPASLKLNWKKEFRKWSTHKIQTCILTTQHKQKMDISAVFIVNYDILAKLTWLKELRWQVVIGDESHYVKNNKAQRSKEFFKIAKKAQKRVYLTGTPIMNKPIELYHPLKSLGWSMSWRQYTERYCAAYFNGFAMDVSGASNLEELQQKLRESVMIRRMKKDVITELPDKIHQIINFTGSQYDEFLKSEQRTQEQYDQRKAQIRAEMKMINDKQSERYKELQSEFGTLQMHHLAEMTRLRRETALLKVPDAAEMIADAIDSGSAPLVFAHHKEVIERLQNAMIKYRGVKVIGGMSAEDKQRSVDTFQNGDADYFLGSITAAGVGLTLTRSDHVIFIEQDWRPGMMQQAEDRAHRIGQKNSVLVQVIVVDGSIDSKMAKMLVKKADIAKKALNS